MPVACRVGGGKIGEDASNVGPAGFDSGTAVSLTEQWSALMTSLKSIAGGALALSLLATPTFAAPAAPAKSTVEAGAIAPATTEIRWRRGWGPGVGIGLGILGGAIIANELYRPRRGYYYDDYAYEGPYYRPSGYSGDPRRLCAQNFRSFEWRTGLYTTYSGEKRLCPYLQ
jgi:hypothetical protein